MTAQGVPLNASEAVRYCKMVVDQGDLEVILERLFQSTLWVLGLCSQQQWMSKHIAQIHLSKVPEC